MLFPRILNETFYEFIRESKAMCHERDKVDYINISCVSR